MRIALVISCLLLTGVAALAQYQAPYYTLMGDRVSYTTKLGTAAAPAPVPSALENAPDEAACKALIPKYVEKLSQNNWCQNVAPIGHPLAFVCYTPNSLRCQRRE
jgi:hypothetical protein